MELNSSEATPASESPVVATPKISSSLYLFFDHSCNPTSEWSHALYKIDSIAKPEITPQELSPILEFPIEKYATGMRCARLGSKIYFLGGSKGKDRGRLERWLGHVEDVRHPRDVYSFDILTGVYTKMDARLNAGKPAPCVVFAANGKLYALGRIPYYVPLSEISKLNLFECFDPVTNEWRVLDALPPVDIGRDDLFKKRTRKGIKWVGCTVLGKRQQVVFIGRVFPPCEDQYFKFVYHLKQGKWTNYIHGEYLEGMATLDVQEACDKDYLYGLPFISGPPLKLKSEYVSGCRRRPPFVDDDGMVIMTIPHTPKEEVYDLFNHRRLYSKSECESLLRYIGDDHFCYITYGKLHDLDSPYYDEYYNPDPSDMYTRGITITLFKEEKKLCFQARILHSKSYTITTPFTNLGELKGCFFVNPEQLQKKQDKKKNRKKRNV